MSAPEAPVRRLLFVADAAVADVHDLPSEARADVDQFRHLADERLDTVLGHMRSVGVHANRAHNRGSDHANWQERGLEERLQKRFGLPLVSYAVDSRGHATGAQHP